jgi:hypothetical protein
MLSAAAPKPTKTTTMSGTKEKRKRDLGVEKEENNPGMEEKQKQVKKSRRSSVTPKIPYSKDDFEKYMQDGRMDWDRILESFNFHVEYLGGKQVPPPHSTQVFEFESDVDKNLNARYVIQPGEVWKSMNRYRKFTSKSSPY